MIRRVPSRPAAVLLLALASWAAPASAAPPAEGACPSVAIGRAGEASEDAGPLTLKEGMIVTGEQLPAIRSLVPEEVWQHRQVFFHEGMRMEIGPCHRRYPTPAFFEEATRTLSAGVKLDEEGNLEGYRAGLPFPPETISPAAPDAGTRWAWNLEQRYRGSGPAGKFRLVDYPSRIGSEEIYVGSFFQVQTGHRADLAASDYRLDVARGSSWAAGGRFDEPFNARHLAWRQIRPAASQTAYSKPDDTFVYVPTMRKPRRSATPWVDGMYVPRYTAAGDSGGGAVPFGNGNPYSVDSINPTAGLSIAQTEHMRRGFVGMALRPNAYDWSYVGERDVLAPINSFRPGWPENPDRNFGEYGLSVASDRWDVRHVVVIDGRSRKKEDDVGRLTIYVDWQTQQPLYWVQRKSNGLILDVGILVHRFSGDVADYPAWPDGQPALVFDPVAAAFFSTVEGGTGWRRESYGVVSVPLPGQDLRAMTSTDALVRGR